MYVTLDSNNRIESVHQTLARAQAFAAQHGLTAFTKKVNAPVHGQYIFSDGTKLHEGLGSLSPDYRTNAVEIFLRHEAQRDSSIGNAQLLSVLVPGLKALLKDVNASDLTLSPDTRIFLRELEVLSPKVEAHAAKKTAAAALLGREEDSHKYALHTLSGETIQEVYDLVGEVSKRFGEAGLKRLVTYLTEGRHFTDDGTAVVLPDPDDFAEA